MEYKINFVADVGDEEATYVVSCNVVVVQQEASAKTTELT